MKIKYIIAMAFILVSVAACASTGNRQEDIVVSRLQNLKPEVQQELASDIVVAEPKAILVDVANINNSFLSKTVAQFMEDATEVVFTERQYLKEEFQESLDLSEVIVLTIPIVVNEETGETSVDGGAVATTLGGIVGAIYPPALPFIPLLGLLPWLAKKRSRTHLKDAIVKFVPTDGNMDIGGAISSGMKALGLDHTTADPEELERVAKKLRVKEAAKNGELSVLHDSLEAAKVKITK